MILERFLAERSASLGFNQILADSELSKGTAHRLLSEMAEVGLLTQGSLGGKYRLGPLLLSAGALAAQVDGLAEAAAPQMEALRKRFGETTVLAELRGDSVVPTMRLDGLHEMRLNQEVGRLYPAFAGATGQVLLAHLPTKPREAYLDHVQLERLTDATLASVGELRAVLDRVRGAGVGVSVGQRVPEAVAIAAPIYEAEGNLLAALTVSGVASRWDRERLFTAAVAVKEAAETISRDLGWRMPPEAPTATDLADPSSEPARLLASLCGSACRGRAERAGARGRSSRKAGSVA